MKRLKRYLDDGRRHDDTTLRATADHQFMTELGEMMAIDEIFQRGLELKQVEAPWPQVLRCA